MKKVIGIILIVIALGSGYLGIQNLSKSSESIEIGNIELSAENQDKSNAGYLYIGLSLASLLGGVFLIRSKQ